VTDKSDYLRDIVIDSVLRNTAFTGPATVYVALFHTSNTVEVTGTGYVRVAVAFDAPSTPGETQNTAAVVFPVAGASWGTVDGVRLYDAITVGNILYSAAPTASKLISLSDKVEFAIGDIEADET
jgi:hypothetical protein